MEWHLQCVGDQLWQNYYHESLIQSCRQSLIGHHWPSGGALQPEPYRALHPPAVCRREMDPRLRQAIARPSPQRLPLNSEGSLPSCRCCAQKRAQLTYRGCSCGKMHVHLPQVQAWSRLPASRRTGLDEMVARSIVKFACDWVSAHLNLQNITLLVKRCGRHAHHHMCCADQGWHLRRHVGRSQHRPPPTTL
jgi:hypothetical protein